MMSIAWAMALPSSRSGPRKLQHIDDENGEIAMCILSAINMGKIRDLEVLDVRCDLAVRMLDELIDFKGYPVRAAELAT